MATLTFETFLDATLNFTVEPSTSFLSIRLSSTQCIVCVFCLLYIVSFQVMVYVKQDIDLRILCGVWCTDEPNQSWEGSEVWLPLFWTIEQERLFLKYSTTGFKKPEIWWKYDGRYRHLKLMDCACMRNNKDSTVCSQNSRVWVTQWRR